MSVDSEIRTAIAEHRMMRCLYDGYSRVFEPHLYGLQGGVVRLQVYQTGGASGSGRLPDWRLFSIDKMRSVTALKERFPGPRTAAGRSTRFDRILAAVQSNPTVPRLTLPAVQASTSAVRELPLLPGVSVDPSFAFAVETISFPVRTMLDPTVSDLIVRTIEQRMAQFRREFAEAIRRDQEKNASMGRNGGIALHFPMETAGREIDRRVDFAWEHIKAVLAAGGIAPSPGLVNAVRMQLDAMRDLLVGDIATVMDQIASRNGGGSLSQRLDARWNEGMARSLSSAEVYSLALHSQEQGKVKGPPGVTLSGTVHSAVFQYGPNATANVNQTIGNADIDSLIPLLNQLLEEVRQVSTSDSQDTSLAVSVIEKARDEIVAQKISVDGLAGALTFVLGTWDKLKTLGALVPLRAWLATHGVALPIGGD